MIRYNEFKYLSGSSHIVLLIHVRTDRRFPSVAEESIDRGHNRRIPDRSVRINSYERGCCRPSERMGAASLLYVSEISGTKGCAVFLNAYATYCFDCC